MKKKFVIGHGFSGILCLMEILIAGLNIAHSQNDIRFAENKGQWEEQVLFRADVPSGAVFFEDNSILFHFRDDEFLKAAHSGNMDFKLPDYIQHHAFRVRFEGAADKVNCYGTNPGSDYENYFIGKNSRKWASHVQNYESIVYQALYKEIDLIVHGKENGLKYDFLVHPGGNPNEITIDYEGLKSVYLKRGDLYLKTSLNEIVEMKPVAYQFNGRDSIAVDCKFKLRDNQVTFKFPRGYDKDLELVIDPHLVFSTYSGSTSDNWGFTATFDSKGNVYSGGIVAGPGYPVSDSAFIVNFQSGDLLGQSLWDVALIKYDSTGTQRLWASYLGGMGDEMPHSLVVDNDDNLIVLGTTGSINFPVDTNAYDTTFNGGGWLRYASAIGFSNGVDIFITKIDEDGDSLIASTFFGGNGNDGINFRPRYETFTYYLGDSIFHNESNDSLFFNYGDGARGEIFCDTSNYVYIGSCTFSTDFPVKNAFQDTLGGRQDGIAFKLSQNLDSLIWSTYIGGSKDDAIYSIDVSDNGKVYVGGGTNSDNFPTSSNALNTGFQGGSADGFASIIHPDGSSLLASTYFGCNDSIGTTTNVYDQVFFVRIDEEEKIYITGQTRAPASSLIVNDPKYSSPNSGQFIAKLSENLDSIEWSTVFGTGDGDPDISITAFAVGLNDKIFLSGWGREWGNLASSAFIGIKNMETTQSAFQPVSDGQDFYVMVMTDDAACLEYATFFGEQYYPGCSNSGRDHVDGGTSRFDKNGFIYQAACASCGKCQKFPVLPDPGAWSTSNASPNCNNAVFKFAFESPDYLPDVHRCNTDFAELGSILTSDPASSYSWTPANLVSAPGSGHPVPQTQSDTTIFTVEVTKEFCTTTYYQRFYQHFLTLEVPGDQAICDTDSMLLFANAQWQSDIMWSSDPAYSDNLSNSQPGFYANPQNSTTYYCRASNDYCMLEDSVQFTVHNVSVNADDDFTICFGDSVVLNAISTYSGQSIEYAWTPTEVILEGANTGTPTIFIDETTVFTVHATNTALADCEDSDVISVYVSPFSMTTNEIIVETLDSIFETQSVLIPTETNPLLNYNWHSILAMDDSTKADILATPEASGYYHVTVTDEYGCWKKDSIFIFVEDVYCNEDHVYVPNAFSPNNDSKNDLFMVQSRMTNDIYFAVYNRWGQKVFETTEVGRGWDGTYKGKPEPEGVFVYYMKATCWDGSSFEKKGNVTLLR
ncbi:MAG: gliding motility-associated C-terminal domain-containing protein [Bacteroidales bacterium]|nr:gliding motility-associated C-terminal domain-containing protein [Bacteroidales bacterium]MCF8454435.1 gliding motility-associated C-terminal domain-containing protein [Bacteroidales bacterium]